HGTDFASYVEGMPVNMPTHAHGQGYSDINFLIPELIDRMEYRKGTYYADEGNFSAAGAVHISYVQALTQGFVSASAGSDDYARVAMADSAKINQGDLLIGMDATYANGPWQLTEHLHKYNGVVKYTQGNAEQGFSIEGMGYSGRWRSTDQIPLRAVLNGDINRFGYIDPTDGGSTHRYSVSMKNWGPLGKGQWSVEVYGINYGLDLFSDFTYFTDAVHGDQFEQFDSRSVLGGVLRYPQTLTIVDHHNDIETGLQVRDDDIAPVGLYRTQQRIRYDTVREDRVRQTSYSLYASDSTQWMNGLRTTAGVRFDQFQFRVNSSLAINSGNTSDHLLSPKFTMTLGPWSKTEFFIDWGEGFHSNDARGATIKVNPNDDITPVAPVTPLVRAVGSEIGMRSAVVPRLQFAMSLWTLKLNSELLFSGDGGITEPSRASRRTGLELSAYCKPFDALIMDADAAWSHARFTDDDVVGDRIPNAVERVFSVGVTYNAVSGWFGGARLRYLGPAPLIEDNSVRSHSTLLVNLELGYHLASHLSLGMTVLNAFDAKANDITYYYESQLANESSPVNDIHFHPVEPREFRMTIKVLF
ncbi:MAG: TonB-dependent receptor, partial [Steroidobacter sp.]